MTLDRYCRYWEPPEDINQKKCKYRKLSEALPGRIGEPVCLHLHHVSFNCIKENEYRYKISADISQELPEGGLSEVGAPIPPIPRMESSTAGLRDTMADGSNAVDTFARAMSTLRRNEVRPLGDELRHGDFPVIPDSFVPESLNPKHCSHYKESKSGTCENLHWCFRVFGTNLQCQAVRKDTVELNQPENRRLELS